MTAIYIATSLLNADRARQIMARFIELGVSITYDWTVHASGQVYSDDDLATIGKAEVAGVTNCDVLFLIQPGRNGSHFEMGLAHGLNKPVVILEEVAVERKTFYYLDNVHRFKTEQDAINFTLDLLGHKHERHLQPARTRCDASQ
jgi:hypothetical protein